jgi:hypothetical protein
MTIKVSKVDTTTPNMSEIAMPWKIGSVMITLEPATKARAVITMGRVRARQSDIGRHDLKQGQILSEPRAMWEVDPGTCTLEDVSRPTVASLELSAERDCQCNTLAAWFDARLSEHVRLGNGPGEPDTHWGRSIFPVGRVLDLTRGARVRVRFEHAPRGSGESVAAWDVRTDGYRFSSSDPTILTRQK